SVIGDTAVYISTRAEHHGPLGGGTLAIIARHRSPQTAGQLLVSDRDTRIIERGQRGEPTDGRLLSRHLPSVVSIHQRANRPFRCGHLSHCALVGTREH